MRLRTVQFACFVVLLSAVGAVAARGREDCRECASLRVMLAQIAGVTGNAALPPPVTAVEVDQSLPVAEHALAAQPWSMRSPQAQSARQHEVTGSGL